MESILRRLFIFAMVAVSIATVGAGCVFEKQAEQALRALEERNRAEIARLTAQFEAAEQAYREEVLNLKHEAEAANLNFDQRFEMMDLRWQGRASDFGRMQTVISERQANEIADAKQAVADAAALDEIGLGLLSLVGIPTGIIATARKVRGQWQEKRKSTVSAFTGVWDELRDEYPEQVDALFRSEVGAKFASRLASKDPEAAALIEETRRKRPARAITPPSPPAA